MHSIADHEANDEALTSLHTGNPLLLGIQDIISRVEHFKEEVRSFYFEVVLSPHTCPQCSERLAMTGLSECSCARGHMFDPTIAFQVSDCCQAKLIKKTFHYACSQCQKTVSSRFLFDERVFDTEYFREMMQSSRIRAREKREEVRRLLAESRSGTLLLMDEPQLDAVPDLIRDLDEFILGNPIRDCLSSLDVQSGFNLAAYRSHILTLLEHHAVYFSAISPLMGDCRRDRVRRFITLVFMDNDQEIHLQQHGDDLLIRRRHNEAYAEG
ncbi:MAG: hypothetical protein AB2L22_13195 [Syntrophales bacterium]